MQENEANQLTSDRKKWPLQHWPWHQTERNDPCSTDLDTRQKEMTPAALTLTSDRKKWPLQHWPWHQTERNDPCSADLDIRQKEMTPATLTCLTAVELCGGLAAGLDEGLTSERKLDQRSSTRFFSLSTFLSASSSLICWASSEFSTSLSAPSVDAPSSPSSLIPPFLFLGNNEYTNFVLSCQF